MPDNKIPEAGAPGAEALSDLSERMRELNDQLTSLPNRLGESDESVGAFARGLNDASGAARNFFQSISRNVGGSKDLMEDMAPTSAQGQSFLNTITSAVTSGVKKALGAGTSAAKEGLGGMFGVMEKYIEETNIFKDGLDPTTFMQQAETSAKNFAGTLGFTGSAVTDVAGGLARMAATEGFEALLRKANATAKGFLDVEQKIRSLDKEGHLVGTNLGKTFADAAKSQELFAENFVKIGSALRLSTEQMLPVSQALKSYFDAEEQLSTDKFEDLGNSAALAGTPINLMSSALMVSAATGAQAADVANMLSSAIVEMGMSHEKAVASMGTMHHISKETGIGFDVTSKAIFSSAENLKMWGGTIDSVAPLFKAFGESLAGIGRRGLTPQLLQQFVSGIDRMGIGTRALLGMQLPGMQGRGALSAGLEMERAMETGEGMGDVIGGLKNLLENMGGGRVLTREQAIEEGQESQFLVQRGLVEQQLGMDTASATRMLEMLAGGLDFQADYSMEPIREMMESAKGVQDAATGKLLDAQIRSDLVVQSAGRDVVEAIGGIGTFTQFAKEIEKLADRLVVGKPREEPLAASVAKADASKGDAASAAPQASQALAEELSLKETSAVDVVTQAATEANLGVKQRRDEGHRAVSIEQRRQRQNTRDTVNNESRQNRTDIAPGVVPQTPEVASSSGSVKKAVTKEVEIEVTLIPKTTIRGSSIVIDIDAVAKALRDRVTDSA